MGMNDAPAQQSPTATNSPAGASANTAGSANADAGASATARTSQAGGGAAGAGTPAAAPANPYLQVKGLCKHYGEGEARVSVLHAQLRRGKRNLRAVGPFGQRKVDVSSTWWAGWKPPTLVHLGGRHEPHGAHARYTGEYRRDKLGFVFQFYNLVPDLTIRENIEVTAHLPQTRLHRRLCCAAWASTSTARSSRAKFPAASSSVAPSAARS